MRSSKKRRGFTLVEILVVIAIIIILASLIFPAVQRARARASLAQDMSNLRQMTLAWIMYQDNNKGQMMPVSTWIDDPALVDPVTNPKSYWFGTIVAGENSGDPERLDFDTAFLNPYLEGSQEVYRDPTFTESLVGSLRYGKLTTGYAYNYKYLGPGPKINYDTQTYIGKVDKNIPISNNYAGIKQTSRTVVFADSAQLYDNFGQMTTPVLRENWYLDGPAAGNPTVHYRHIGDAANVAFADGHVETLKYVEPHKDNYPTWFTASQIEFARKKKLGYVGIRGDTQDLNKNGIKDDLEDWFYNLEAEPVDFVPSPGDPVATPSGTGS
jgi:prepilin-type N-terminal cleavage/methylation domain-containing protein/prepilin-type processing-associated H-X9-DG protein